MGKKLDALLGKSFKTSKFKAMAHMAISRLAVLRNQRQARCAIARSDVVEFLNVGNHERALLRAEQVIKEQNMLDVFVLLEGYCHLMIERVSLIEKEKTCPEELKEAISSLIYASTRCGEFPELQEIRTIFTSRFGKEFANRAVELRNNCGVNPKIIQKLSTRMASLETKMKVLKEIASDNNIVMQIQEEDQDKQSTISSTAVSEVITPVENKQIQAENLEIRGEEFTDSFKMRRTYRDVADAAQAAFESAAYAAVAARAAVELSRSGSRGPHDLTVMIEPTVQSELQFNELRDSFEDEHMKTEVKFEKIHPIQNNDLEAKKGNDSEEFKKSLSISTSDSVDENVNEMTLLSDEEGRVETRAREVVSDESDGENEKKSRIPWTRTYNVESDEKNDIVEGSSRKPKYSVHEHSVLRSEVAPKMELGLGNSPEHFTAENRTQSAEPLNINKRPISVRTRRAHGR